MADRTRAWCFTLHDPQTDLQHLTDVADVRYAIWQLEITPTTGREHFQGYIYFTNKKSMQQVKTLLQSNTVHVVAAKGSPTQNRAYCSKLESRCPGTDFWEIGELPVLGKRTDYDELKTALQNGLTQSEYIDQYFDTFLKHPHLLKHWNEAFIQPRKQTDGFNCKLFYGPAGTGKSLLAHHLASRDGHNPYRYSLRGFWDGYIGQRRVIFDDFRGCSIPYGDFKQTVDRYPFRINIKHSSCELAANEFYITSNFTPSEWWSEEVTGKDLSALFRRIHEVYFFEEKGKFRHYTSYDLFARNHLNGSLAPNLQAEIPPLQEIILNDEEEIQEIRLAL